MTTVYVTHDQIEAMTMAEKIVVLREGLVEQIGSPLELYDRPANIFVASFIGSPAMNMLRGRLEGGEAPRLTLASGLTIPLRHAPTAALGREITLGVRPEHISVGGASPTPALVSVVEPTGAETFVDATLGGVEIVCVLKERVSCRPGETLPLSFDAAPLHFFDETGAVVRG